MALWPERSEVDTADRVELLQHIKGELFQTPKLRCDHRARTQVCATAAGTSTLACRTDRRSRTLPEVRVEIVAPRCDDDARSSVFSARRAVRELHLWTRLIGGCAAGRPNHRNPTIRPACMREESPALLPTHTRWQVSRGVFESINKVVDAPRCAAAPPLPAPAWHA